MTDPREDHPLADLIARARDGDRADWGRICARYSDQLRERARKELRKRGCRDHQSMDILQSIFKDLPKDLRGYRHESESKFVNWWTKIVVRKVLAEKKKHALLKAGGACRIEAGERGRDLMEAQPACGGTPSQDFAASEEKELLARALACLDPKHREPLMLHLDGLTAAQIGQKLDCKADAARMKVARAEFELERETRRLRKASR